MARPARNWLPQPAHGLRSGLQANGKNKARFWGDGPEAPLVFPICRAYSTKVLVARLGPGIPDRAGPSPSGQDLARDLPDRQGVDSGPESGALARECEKTGSVDFLSGGLENQRLQLGRPAVRTSNGARPARCEDSPAQSGSRRCRPLHLRLDKPGSHPPRWARKTRRRTPNSAKGCR